MSDIRNQVKGIISKRLDVDPSKVVDQAHFANDLGADSLDQVELVMAFETEFGIEIPSEDAEKIATVHDAFSYIEKAVPALAVAANH